jgi:hypothetical protein
VIEAHNMTARWPTIRSTFTAHLIAQIGLDLIGAFAQNPWDVSETEKVKRDTILVIIPE